MNLGQSVACALLALGLVFVPARAADWAAFGPSAGAVRSLAQDAGGAIFAGTYAGGVFKSTDNGASWTPIAPEIRDQTINALAIDRNAPQTVFAGTYSRGVWRSSDGGASWKRVLFGGKDMPTQHAAINGLAIDPANAKIVYAATDTGPNAGVWRSADGGTTWAQSTAGLPNHFRLNAIAIDPQAVSTLYVATNGDGVFKSTDAGRTWQATGEALRKEIVLSLAVDPTAPQTIYAGTSGAGAFRSTDGGATWTPSEAAPIRRGRVYALAIDPTNPAILWAGLPNKLLRTQDGGRTWTDTMPELEYASVRALLLDGARPSVVLAGTTRDGVRRSDNGGKSWTGPGTGFHALDVTGIASDPERPQYAWIASSTGIWRTRDGGTTWALASKDLTSRSANCIVRDASTRTLFACTGDGVFRSTNDGDQWIRQKDGLSRDTRIIGVALDPNTPGTLYTRDVHWVYSSSDGGINWSKSPADLETSGTINGLFALAAPPGSPGTVFASVFRHFWKSTDSGRTFAKSGTGLPLARVQTVASDDKGTTLWLGTEGEGVWRSGDGGATWVPSHAGMGAVNVQALLADPAHPGTLYAAAWGKGLFRSTDAGRNWMLVGGAPPHPDVIALALDPSAPGRLLAGTGGGGVWRVETGAR